MTDPTNGTTEVDRLLSWPRRELANLPTRLLRVERLGREVGLDRLYVKMDAETGFALGGNKVRKLEYELTADRLEGVTCLITAGGPQSNHCRVTAALAAREGLDCVIVANAPAPERPSGNALLHRLFGADVVTVPDRTDRIPAMELVARRIEAEGGRALIVPIGASTPLGSLGYARAAVELAEQLDALDDGCTHTTLFSSTSSCGTMAGLLLGFALLGRTDVDLVGVSADSPADELTESTIRIARGGAALLSGGSGADAVPSALSRPGAGIDLEAIRLSNDDREVGAGYGIPTPSSLAATEMFGRLAGIVLDPTYTSKAAAGLLEWSRREKPPREHRVVFLHTGGAPGLLV